MGQKRAAKVAKGRKRRRSRGPTPPSGGPRQVVLCSEGHVLSHRRGPRCEDLSCGLGGSCLCQDG